MIDWIWNIVNFLPSLLAFIVIFSFLIVVHECGHFFTAIWSGVKVEEFGIGMGKRLWGIRRNDIDYTLNTIPFGGFVRMLGEEETSKDPRAFMNAKLWKRMAITLAGVTMNFVSAIVLLSVLFTLGTRPIMVTEQDVLDAEKAGYIRLLEKNEAGSQEIEWVQDMQKNFPYSVGLAITESARISVAIVQKAAEIPVILFQTHRVPETIAGPVGIAEITHKILPYGLKALLKLTAMLSLSLAVMNLLPIPALDGGRFFFQLVEMILKPFRVRISPQLEQWVHMGGFVLLLGLIFLITWNDIWKLLK